MTSPSEVFIRALNNRDIKGLQGVAKVDLHNHFYLGGHRDYIKKRTGVSIPPLAQKLNSMDEMHQWVGKYIGDIFETTEKRTVAIEACFQQAADDGVSVLETGDDVLMLNRVDNLKNHPIRTLFDYGVRVTINSDDILVFGQSVSKEYLDLYEAGVFNAEELNIIRKNGLESRGIVE